MASKLAVVISQSPSKNPAKRKLEEDIVTGLLFEPGIDVTLVPNLYDLKPDSTGMLALSGIQGHMVVAAWLYERATRWILDRNQIRGNEGATLLGGEDDEDDDDEFADEAAEAEAKARVLESRGDAANNPQRKIFCLDLRASESATEYIEEIKRIQQETSVRLVQLGDLLGSSSSSLPASAKHANGQSNGKVPADAAQRFVEPTNDTALPILGPGSGNGSSNGAAAHGEAPVGAAANGTAIQGQAQVTRIEADAGRRWYPVIDFSRCTNCMECIDFCLFGVYGVDNVDTILVEQPDNCRKGCPACSRVCPENAIIFPQHKTPAIAGAMEAAGSMKIDLSQLFGAPESGKSAEEIAAMERDEQLLAAGRDAVGMTVGIPKRQVEQPAGPKDDLDQLIDQLDELDI